MNIAFCGGKAGGYGVSSNMIAISVLIGAIFDAEVLYINATDDRRICEYNYGLEEFQKRESVELFREDYGYYGIWGLEDVMSANIAGNDDKELEGIFNENLYDVRDTRIRYISTNNQRSESVIYGKGAYQLREVMSLYRRNNKLCLIDMSGDWLSNNELTDLCDMIVYHVGYEQYSCQEHSPIPPNIRNKCILVAARLEEESDYIKEKLSKLYQLRREDIYYIPENRDFELAIQRGDIIKFIKKGIQLSSYNYNYEIINCLYQIAVSILERQK